MFLNKVAGFFLASAVIATPSIAQLLTVSEATLKQSEIARAELDSRLADIRNKSGAPGGVQASAQSTAQPAARAPSIAEKDADEVLSLVSVYGIGTKLKADFLFRGAVITLEAGGATEAAGWRVEKLTKTEAVLVKMAKNRVIKRSTVYLATELQSATQATRETPLPFPAQTPGLSPGAPPVAAPAFVQAR